MKLYESLDMEQMRETWAVKDNAELSYYGGKMPALPRQCRHRNPE